MQWQYLVEAADACNGKHLRRDIEKPDIFTGLMGFTDTFHQQRQTCTVRTLNTAEINVQLCAPGEATTAMLPKPGTEAKFRSPCDRQPPA